MFRYAVIALLFMLTGSRALMFCTGGTCIHKPMSLKETFAQLDQNQHSAFHRAILPCIPECVHVTFSHVLDYPMQQFTIPRHILLRLFSLPDPTDYIISTRPPRLP